MVALSKWINFVLFLHQFSRVKGDQCAPCLCICKWVTQRPIAKPCVDCDRQNLISLPSFRVNFTRTIKTLSLHGNHIKLERGVFKDYTNLEYLSLDRNGISMVPPNTFQELKMLEYLTLRYNRITNVSEGAFTGLSMLKELDMENNRIGGLAPNIFQGLRTLETLYLQSNRINTVSEGAFAGLAKLKTLWMRRNQIETLLSNSFQGLKMLEKLDLNYNKIVNISEGAFKGLLKLKELSMNTNQIETLLPKTFQGLITLDTLNLAYNRIMKVSEGAFTGLLKLKKLWMSYNQIETLLPRTFLGLVTLEELNLRNNRIVNVFERAFSGLSKLKKLVLDNNQIQVFLPNTFKGLITLEELYLESNRINNVSEGAFAGLTKLKTLGMQHNQIERLQPNGFQGLITLEKLYLNHNRIVIISEDAFKGLLKLKLLVMEHNPIERLLPNSFRGLLTLEQLSLRYNRIIIVSEHAFNGLLKLKRLFMDNNLIETLQPNTFHRLEMLDLLQLKFNKISRISMDAFNGLTMLQTLLITSNRMHTIQPHLFRKLLKLQWLGLDSNMISNMSKDSFDGLLRLKGLDLHNNTIQNLQSDVFLHLKSLEGLILDKNRISVIGRRAFLHFGNIHYLSLQANHPRFKHITLNLENNLFHCSCKMINALKQFQTEIKRLQPTASSLKSKCMNTKNVTTLCEEERNFALGMKADHTCYNRGMNLLETLEPEHFVTDEDIGTCAYCFQERFNYQVSLPGVIVVTKVVVVLKTCTEADPNITVAVGDNLSGSYTSCYQGNLIYSLSSRTTTLNASCMKTPIGRDVGVEISFSPDSMDDRCVVCEIKVQGYEQNKYNIWGSWNEWEPCSKTCGNGYRRRQRVCNNSTSLACLVPGPTYRRAMKDIDEERCNHEPCFQAVYQWTIGVVAGVFILTLFAIIFWYRKYKMITYLDGLRPNPNFQMDPDRTLLEQIEELPYDLHWEFPRYDVKFSSVLGEGNFGKVWHAMAKGIKAFNPRDKSDLSSRAKLAKLQDQQVHEYFTTVTEAWVLGDCDTTHHYDVAVKTLKECATPQHERDLATELKLLIYMGPHPNIVNVLASCTIRGDLWVILEYCHHGCLKDFLSDRRNLFTPSWSRQSADVLTDICFFDLLKMCEQITKGVMFLHCWNVVHRDLSARNILVDANFNVKVADFGLARSNGFIVAEDDIMPIKWSALESLLRQEYSSKSDIWSVGVLFWEIFSLGEVPYPGMKSRDVVQQLKEGYRMNAPDHCPEEVWRIISDCWNADPELRSSAVELYDQLDELKVAVCSAPDGQYYGTGDEYGQAGTVQGPSSLEILQSSENFGYEDEVSATKTIVDIHKTLSHDDMHIIYEQYRILETEIHELKNENQCLKEENENLRQVNEAYKPQDEKRSAGIKENIDRTCNETECRAIDDIDLQESSAPTHDTNEIIETTDL